MAEAYAKGLLEGYELVGAFSRTAEKTAALAARTGCKACASLDELLTLKPDYVVETASVEMVRQMALPVLSHGASLVLISIGALADEEFRARVESAARENGVKVHLASGAVGGFDVLRTVTLMAQAQGLPETAEIDGVKAVVDIYSRTSAIAGWSVVALLRNLASPIMM